MAWKRGRHLSASHKRAISRALLGKKRTKAIAKADRKNQKHVVRRTAFKATTAGIKGGARAIGRGAFHGAKMAAIPAALLGVAAYKTSPYRSGRASAKYGIKVAGTTLAAGAAIGAYRSRPLSHAGASASASAKLGLANRKVALDRKAGLTRKQSLANTYRGYGKGKTIIRTIKKVK